MVSTLVAAAKAGLVFGKIAVCLKAYPDTNPAGTVYDRVIGQTVEAGRGRPALHRQNLIGHNNHRAAVGTLAGDQH
jgi:hypothetical protein